MTNTNVIEEKYREAYLKWKEEHPNENPKHDLDIELKNNWLRNKN